ncbi:MAG: DUF305 domain-containing protein [Thermoanaerobaculia bacterium]
MKRNALVVLADRMFADAMAQHHRDGVRMAQMAVQKAASAELRTMSQRMIDDQQREIGELQSLRGDAPMTPMSEMMSMPGMMPESEMQSAMTRLENASGRDFDVAFTEIMPRHHQSAITMARAELPDLENAGLREIACRRIDPARSQKTKRLRDEHRAAFRFESNECVTSSQQREPRPLP